MNIAALLPQLGWFVSPVQDGWTSRQFDDICREVEADQLQQLQVDEEVRSSLG